MEACQCKALVVVRLFHTDMLSELNHVMSVEFPSSTSTTGRTSAPWFGLGCLPGNSPASIDVILRRKKEEEEEEEKEEEERSC